MASLYNGYFTKYLSKYLGFKGTAFCLSWAALFKGLATFDWPFVTLVGILCGLKVTEDWINTK